MKDDADAADASLLLQGKDGLKSLLLPEDLIVHLILLVQEVEIEVVHAAVFKLFFKQRADIRLFHETGFLQLVGKNILIPGNFFRHTLTEGALRSSVQHIVGGIEIIESRVQKGLGKTPKLFSVHLSVFHRKARTAKSEISFDF